MELVEGVYKLTKQLPKSEIFGLSSQVQRAAVGIPSSIAEGAKRNHRNEYIQFLAIANGSAAELETQLILIGRLYPDLEHEVNNLLSLLEEILKMLHSLIFILKR